MESTEESRAFRQEFEMAKLRQDEALTEISSGLTTLKSVANDMSEEMKVQNQLMDEIEDKVTHVLLNRSLIEDTLNKDSLSLNCLTGRQRKLGAQDTELKAQGTSA